MDKQRNEWVYGYFVQWDDKCFIIEYGKKGIPPQQIEVISKSVGQFTGLLDKNGVEVYEFDVLKWDDSGDTGYVEYSSESTEYMVDEWKTGETRSKGHSLCALGEVEVIGNIYEHPHLLTNNN